MPYAFVQDVAASWEHYERIAAALVDPAPEGLVLHVAGPTDEGFRIIAVWESEEAWQRFRAAALLPAVAALGGPSRPEPTFRDLSAAHVVVGSGAATSRGDVQTKAPLRDYDHCRGAEPARRRTDETRSEEER